MFKRLSNVVKAMIIHRNIYDAKPEKESIHQIKKQEPYSYSVLNEKDCPFILRDFSGGFKDQYFLLESNALKKSDHMLSLYPNSRCSIVPNPEYKEKK